MQVAVKRISVQPAIFTIENFLEHASCDHLAVLVRDRLRKDEAEENDQRRSTLFSRDDMRDIPLLSTIARRQRNLVRELVSDQNDHGTKDFLRLYPVDVDFAEVLEAIEFSTGGYRRLHNEAFHRDRVLATLVFLEDTPMGGETVFPMLSWDGEMEQYVPSNYFQTKEQCVERDEVKCGTGSPGYNYTAMGLNFCCCSELLRIRPKKVPP
eukprot:COSAG05_NODE_396_length_10336_cov_233.199863_11_plen_210_part_00